MKKSMTDMVQYLEEGEKILNVVLDIFKTFYESLWISLILAFLFSVCSLYVAGFEPERLGWKGICILWMEQFKSTTLFRHKFFLYIYTAMILYQTLLGREIWRHPLEAVFGNWRLVNGLGEISTQILENILIFVPFTILLFWVYGEKVVKGKTVWSYLVPAFKTTIGFSLSIEIAQAVLHLGTLQISDFCYNVLGGVLGGLVYWITQMAKNCYKKVRRKFGKDHILEKQEDGSEN